MVTPNKFSNPDTPACDCLRLYADCLIIAPLQAIFCVPFVCCARAHKNHQAQRQAGGDLHEKGAGSEGRVESQPAREPNMAMLPDASKPRDQWPAEWHSPRPEGHVEKGAKHSGAGVEEAGGTDNRTIKDKLADGVLKIATIG